MDSLWILNPPSADAKIQVVNAAIIFKCQFSEDHETCVVDIAGHTPKLIHPDPSGLTPGVNTPWKKLATIAKSTELRNKIRPQVETILEKSREEIIANCYKLRQYIPQKGQAPIHPEVGSHTKVPKHLGDLITQAYEKIEINICKCLSEAVEPPNKS